MKVVLALALAVVLTGCNSGSGTPRETTSPSVTSSTPSPSSTEDLKVVLERVVREYYTEANHALATGDVSRLRTLSIEKCACRQLVSYVERRYREGSLRNAKFIVKHIRPYVVKTARAVVQATLDSPASEVLDRNGNVTKEIPAEFGIKEDLYLIPRGTGWIVENIVGLS